MSEKELIYKLKKTEHIIIYGAGMVGELVYKRLKSNGLAGLVLCFAVSKPPDEEEYLGVPLCWIGALALYGRKAVVIIAALPKLHHEMQALAAEYSFVKVIPVKAGLYSSMGRNQIREFADSNKDIEGNVDIALLASDNNCSSGAFLCLADLAYVLKKRGITSVVILPEYGDGERILAERGITYIYIEAEHWCLGSQEKRLCKKLKLLRNRKAVKRMREYFKRHAVRLVHNNTTYTYVGAVAALREGLPFVWHLRENIRNQGYELAYGRKAVELINRSARVIVISEYMARCVSGRVWQEKRVIYDGVDIEKYFSRRDILKEGEPVTIILAGTVIEHKRQEELLEAAYFLKMRTDNFRIIFVGKEEGEYMERLKCIIGKYQLQDCVSFLGKKNNMQDFFREADIAVMCSRDEAFGRVTVEAQLSGCLVIGADSGATAELVADGRTGMLYRPGDAKDLAERIMYAARNPQESGKMARAGQEYALQAYSRENNAEEIIRVYEEVLGRKLV